MTAQNPPTANAPAALSAFLKGVERRAALFADLQGGDPSATEAALASTLGGFVATAARHPVADWPRRFWALLLAAPALRAPSSVAAGWPAAFDRLAQVGRGPRAALLVSLVARLQEDDAAAVLGVAQPTYRLALRRALPVDAEGNPDEATWHELDRAVRQALADLPVARLDRLTRLREAALAGRELAPEPTRQPRQVRGKRPSAAAPRRWVLPVLWVAVGACVVAFVVSFLLPGLLPGPAGNDATGDMAVQERALADTDPPASRFDDDVALLSHGDFDQLADTRDAKLIDTFDFYAWYAAQLQSGAAQALPLPDAAEPLPDPSEVRTMGEEAHAPR